MSNRTYGQLRLSNSYWELVDIEPHVAIRLKQLFPKIPKSQSKLFTLKDCQQTAADLLWFTERYTLKASAQDLRYLKKQSREFYPKKGKWGALIRRGVDTDFPQADLIPAPCFIDDLVWVRETWGVVNHTFDENGNMVEWTPDRPARRVKEMKFGKGYYTGHAIYRADGEMRWCDDFEDEVSAWHPSIHMPRAASRTTLIVTDVRIERVQEITEEQAILEGMPTREEAQRMAVESGLGWYQNPVVWFKNLWDGLYNNWNKNPYVWAIEFKVVKKNISEVLEELKDAA